MSTGAKLTKRPLKFAEGQLGLALDDLFGTADGLDLETNGRVARICRLFEQVPGSDGVHEMVHAELDHLEQVDALAPIAARLRRVLVPRRLPAGAFDDRASG